jgi:SAM-dependent methyltransferase
MLAESALVDAGSEISAGYRLSGVGRAEQEEKRLALLETLFDPVSRRRRSAVKRGWRCLEVGAGRGSMAAWLAEKVGPSGQVIATDIDVTYLQSVDLPNLEVRRHDILDGPIEAGTFDLVCSRHVLFHLVGHQEQALRNMVECLKPGGLLIDEDADWGTTIAIDPSHPTYATYHAAWRNGDWWRSRGYDPSFGRTLSALFERVGLHDVTHDVSSEVVRGGSPWANWYRKSLEVIADASGAPTPDQRGDHEIVTSTLADPSNWFMRELLHGCTGQRPPENAGATGSAHHAR